MADNCGHNLPVEKQKEKFQVRCSWKTRLTLSTAEPHGRLCWVVLSLRDGRHISPAPMCPFQEELRSLLLALQKSIWVTFRVNEAQYHLCLRKRSGEVIKGFSLMQTWVRSPLCKRELLTLPEGNRKRGT